MDASNPPPSSRTGAGNLLRMWFGFEAPVNRRAYVVTGGAMMAAKYLVDATLVYLVAHVFWRPTSYLDPIYTLRVHDFEHAPAWLFVVLGLGTLPFLWVGLTMSVRRAVDAGLSAWVGLAFLLPFLNYALMFALAVWPSREGARWTAQPSVYREGRQERLPTEVDSSLRSALLGVAVAVGVGLAMVAVSVHALGMYGVALFFITPFMMGASSAFLFNRPYPRGLGRTVGVSLASTLIAGGALLLVAAEGFFCLLMALPIAGVIAVFGAVVGRAIAGQTKTPFAHTAAVVLMLPGLAGVEAKLERTPLYEVISAIEIDAPPERVWPNVIGFGELDPPSELVFQTGIAYPLRARIEGSGVGAVRRCEFTTGPFVEPITAWDAPRRLAFDVASQPDAMKEWSPFRYVHPPHLDRSLRSKRGEFRLVPLEGGRRTRLEGSTWYELSMYPEAYWKVWTDGILHAIHTRVLVHVKHLSEAPG